MYLLLISLPQTGNRQAVPLRPHLSPTSLRAVALLTRDRALPACVCVGIAGGAHRWDISLPGDTLQELFRSCAHASGTGMVDYVALARIIEPA